MKWSFEKAVENVGQFSILGTENLRICTDLYSRNIETYKTIRRKPPALFERVI